MKRKPKHSRKTRPIVVTPETLDAQKALDMARLAGGWLP